MAGQELALLNRKLGTESPFALVPYEGPVTREQVALRGRALGLLVGVVDGATLNRLSKIRLQKWEDLDAPLGDIEINEVNGEMLRVFCGAETDIGTGWVARAYVDQGLMVEGGHTMRFVAGVESLPPSDGISKYWFAVASCPKGGNLARVAKVEVTSDGKIFFARGEDEPYDVTRLGQQSKQAIMDTMEKGGIPRQALILAQDLKWVGTLMKLFATHSLCNPYRPWSERQIWNEILGIKYDEWKFCLPTRF